MPSYNRSAFFISQLAGEEEKEVVEEEEEEKERMSVRGRLPEESCA